MIIESIAGVVFGSIVVYLYWKSIEKESNEKLPVRNPVVEKTVVETTNTEVSATTAETSKPEVKPKRAKRKGRFVADDPTTPDVNEAWVGGKAPAKTKTKTTKTKKTEVVADVVAEEAPVKKPRTRKPKMTVLK